MTSRGEGPTGCGPRAFPAELPQSVRANPLRSAECKVFDRLKLLPSTYTVFYSRPWLGLTPDGREVDGEADFVIAHPESGILTIEVKGGSVARNSATEEWTSTDRYGIKHSIKNPVEQARQSKYQLLKKLQRADDWNSRHIRAAHAVVFPDASEPPKDLGADMPRGLFACREQMQTLHEWVQTRMQAPLLATHEKLCDPLGDDGVELLVELIAACFTLHAPLGGQLASAERQIVTLTEQQFEVLDGLDRNPRCVVAGGAGTGKTLLALEKARRLARSGCRTLLTCASRPLAAHLRESGPSMRTLSIIAFEDLASELTSTGATFAQSAVSDAREARARDQVAENLVRALEELPPDRLFDAIVVDEGQDFAASWWAAIGLALIDAKTAHFYVFHDDNQRVYPGVAGWPADLVPYTLTRNLRNSRTICALSLPFYAGSSLKAAGPDGRLVEWIMVGDPSEVPVILNRLVARLTGPDEIRIEDIAILVRTIPPLTAYPGNRASGFALTRASAPARGALVMESVAEFKGLERKVVILLHPETMIDDPEHMYVGLSRARSHLIVVGDGDAMQLLQQLARKAARSGTGR